MEIAKKTLIGLAIGYVCFVVCSVFLHYIIKPIPTYSLEVSLMDHIIQTPKLFFLYTVFTLASVLDPLGALFLAGFVVYLIVVTKILKKMDLSLKIGIGMTIWVMFGSWIVPQLT